MSRNAQSSWFPLPTLAAIAYFAAGLQGPAAPPEVKPAAAANGQPPPASRVVIVEDSEATVNFNPREESVAGMLAKGISRLTGKATATEAWRSLVSTQDIIGIKVFSAPGPNSGTRPAVTAAVVRGLLEAGVKTNQIIIWDKHPADLRQSGHDALGLRFNVRVAAAVPAGFDESAFYDRELLGQLVFGDLEFGRKGESLGRKSHVTKLLTRDMTKIINVTPMLNHNHAGVAGNLYGLAMGSVDNTLRFDVEAARLTRAVPEIYALPAVGDRVVLNIVDALICQYEGEQRSLLHYSVPLNQLRLSTDPVALDVLSLEELDRQRKLAGAPVPGIQFLDLYRNASLLEIGMSDTNSVKIERIGR